MVAASILVYRKNKAEGVKELLKRAFDYKRIKAKVWYAPIVLLVPGVMVLTYGLMRLTGAPLPIPQFPVLAAPVMFLAFFIAALGEELGWSGYVIDPMQDRGTRSEPAFSWGWYGPRGISSRSCRGADRWHGSVGGVSSRWRHGFL